MGIKLPIFSPYGSCRFLTWREYFMLLRLICFEPIDKSSVGGKKTTNKNPTKNMGNFYFVVTQSWQAIPHGFWRNLQALQKQYHMGSEGISRIFKRQLVYKRGLLNP